VLLDVARRIGTAVEALRAAASAAANHRSRSDLAADVGTKITAVFPRQARRRTRRSTTLRSDRFCVG
jgi:hypothetical protein